MSRPTSAPDPQPIRIDLHCHSCASTEADEAVLLALKCPESYSAPAEVYAQAKRRGMDFVTITDHDSIAGVRTLRDRPDVLIGEELTCYFPEDGCKMHILIWGITQDDHTALQDASRDIYRVAYYIAAHRIAHSVAHPLYRQNDLLEKWHIERLILLFKGFELLNGAHSNLHRDAFEPILNDLTRAEIDRLEELHDLAPLWPQPHIKSRTAGSDDHGLFNIGRTWTTFPPHARSIDAILECLRTGDCAPGGEAGSSLKLAHNFLSVGVRYYSRQVITPNSSPSFGVLLLQKLVAEKPPFRKRDMIKFAVKNKLRRIGSVIAKPFKRAKAPPAGVDLLFDLLMKSLPARLAQHDELRAAIRQQQAPVAEHQAMFSLVGAISRDISRGIADNIEEALSRGQIGGLFNALSTVAAHQFALLPYYFALFHQNRERHLFSRLTGRARTIDASNIRVGIFTDTFDDVNGVTRFMRDNARQAQNLGRNFIVHTSSADPQSSPPWRKNFAPLLARRFPMYPQLELNIPPAVEVLEWCDRRQFDAIYVETPGPMGLCGLAAAAMLRVPLLATYHTDLPAYVKDFTGDHRLTCAASDYMNWFYDKCDIVFSRTRQYQSKLRDLGIAEDRLALAPPAIDTTVFNPSQRDPNLWQRLRIRESKRLLFVGRISVEKNLALLADVFKRLCRIRKDTALILAGDGPFAEPMRRDLAGLPVYFLGVQNDSQLALLYASSDLFVFPSRTDTMGQVVIEAQAAGLPVLVSTEGGPREVMANEITGQVLDGTDPTPWVTAIHTLLNDEPRRLRMAHSGPPRMARFSLENAFAGFWEEHVKAATPRPDTNAASDQTQSYDTKQAYTDEATSPRS